MAQSKTRTFAFAMNKSHGVGRNQNVFLVCVFDFAIRLMFDFAIRLVFDFAIRLRFDFAMRLVFDFAIRCFKNSTSFSYACVSVLATHGGPAGRGRGIENAVQ